MTKESAFKSWLEQGGAQTVAGRNSRTSAIRTIGRKLEELGMPFRDLDAAWKADRFESLRERLLRDAGGCPGWGTGLPDSDAGLPRTPTSGFRTGSAGYGNMGGSSPATNRDQPKTPTASWQYVLEHYIEPAREEGREQGRSSRERREHGAPTEHGMAEYLPSSCRAEVPGTCSGSAARTDRRRPKLRHGFSVRSEGSSSRRLGSQPVAQSVPRCLSGFQELCRSGNGMGQGGEGLQGGGFRTGAGRSWRRWRRRGPRKGRFQDTQDRRWPLRTMADRELDRQAGIPNCSVSSMQSSGG